MSDEPLRDRVVRLEVEMDHMDQKFTSMSKKVDEMHEVLLKGRGAYWSLLALVAIVPSSVTAAAMKLIPVIFSTPLPK